MKSGRGRTRFGIIPTDETERIAHVCAERNRETGGKSAMLMPDTETERQKNRKRTTKAPCEAQWKELIFRSDDRCLIVSDLMDIERCWHNSHGWDGYSNG